MNQKLFREKSLDEITSPEQLNGYISVTRTGAWVALCGILVIVIGLIIWSLTGSITSAVRGYGMIFPQMGSENVVSKSSGFVSDVRVRPGDYVSMGDVIAVVPQDDILRQIEAANGDSRTMMQLRRLYRQKTMITSGYDGRVMSVIGSDRMVSVGEPIANIILQSDNYDNKEVIAYLPLSEAQQLQIGMEAEISPDFAPREEYGYMMGYVSEIGTYPTTLNDAKEYLGNFALSDALFPDENFTEVRITLLSDANSPNNIKWSNPKGMNLSIEMGNTCWISITTASSKPIQLLF